MDRRPLFRRGGRFTPFETYVAVPILLIVGVVMIFRIVMLYLNGG